MKTLLFWMGFQKGMYDLLKFKKEAGRDKDQFNIIQLTKILDQYE